MVNRLNKKLKGCNSLLALFFFLFSHSSLASPYKCYISKESKGFQISFPALKETNKPLFPSDFFDKNHFIFSETSIEKEQGNQVFWLHFEIVNLADKDKELLLNFEKWHFIDFFIKKKNQILQKKTGLLVPFKKKDYGVGNKNLISLDIKEGAIVECVVRLEASYNHIIFPGSLKVSVNDKSSFLREELNKKGNHRIILGLFIALFVYNLFIWLSIRDKGYFFYLVFLLLSINGVEHYFGYSIETFQFFENITLGFAKFDVFAGSLTCIVFIFFTVFFLNLRKNLPILYKVFIIFIWVFIIIPFLTFFFPLFIIYSIQSVVIIVASLLALFASIVCYKKNVPSAIYFFLANTFVLTGAIIYLLKQMQILPDNDFTRYSYPIGACLQAVFFSLAFADRINIFRRENLEKHEEISKQIFENQKNLIALKEASLNSEKFKKKSIAFQLEALKNQVNPHFLFNSLNVLIELLYVDQDKAADFVQKLASVYRYILDSKNKTVVTLDEEMEFINSYIFLLQIRFDNNLQVIVNFTSHKHYYVAPLTIQLLIENCIKHNEASMDNPLLIQLSISSENYLVIINNYQKKVTPFKSKIGIGLKNIKARYEFLTTKEIKIFNDQKIFKVEIPLLNEEELEALYDTGVA